MYQNYGLTTEQIESYEHELGNIPVEVLDELYADYPENFAEALNNFRGKYNSISEYAEEEVEEGIFGEIPDTLKFYINYDRLASDLLINDINFYEDEHGYKYIFNCF